MSRFNKSPGLGPFHFFAFAAAVGTGNLKRRPGNDDI
jgi:hypothetical protein